MASACSGAQSASGTLFLDEAHPLEADTQYLVVHGHNMYDGSMFARLTHYRRRAYMEEHPTVDLTTLYRQESYEVVGALRVPGSYKSDGYVAYTGVRKFSSPERFYGFVRSIRERALYWREWSCCRATPSWRCPPAIKRMNASLSSAGASVRENEKILDLELCSAAIICMAEM